MRRDALAQAAKRIVTMASLRAEIAVRPSGAVRPDASQEGVLETVQGRHVRPPNVSRCRHARATPQPVASAATLPRTGRSRASQFSDTARR